MKNNEHYNDKTPHDAMKNINDEGRRFFKFLHTIFYLADLAGFEVQGRIVLKDKKTGKVWR